MRTSPGKPDALKPSDVLASGAGDGVTLKVAGTVCQAVKW